MAKDAGGETLQKGLKIQRQVATKRCFETDKKGEKIGGYIG